MTITILIDDREKLPYDFPRHNTQTKRLATGDYSILGEENNGIAIERKRVVELPTICGKGAARFERELARMSKFSYAAIIIEGDLSDCLRPPRFSNMDPRVFVNRLLSWSVRYEVCVWLVGNRDIGRRATERLLEFYHKWSNLLPAGSGVHYTCQGCGEEFITGENSSAWKLCDSCQKKIKNGMHK